MAFHKPNVRVLSILILVLVLFGLIGAALAETKTNSTWQRYTFTDSGSSTIRSQTNSSTSRYYYDVNLRAWGAGPNALKESDYRFCNNCTATSTADVWNGWIAIYVARHQYVVFNGGITTTDYTSNTGFQSTANCWNTGCP
jgi:hypothetical protein